MTDRATLTRQRKQRAREILAQRAPRAAWTGGNLPEGYCFADDGAVVPDHDAAFAELRDLAGAL